jgi:hypothetical protein
MEILPPGMYNKDVIQFSGIWNHDSRPQCTPSFGKRKTYQGSRKDTMSKTECKMKLKHQLEIGRRLQQLGLYAAATESRTKAQILLQIYKRHFREEPVNLH